MTDIPKKNHAPKVPVSIFIARIAKLTDTERAYLAAIVDGEGSLGLYRNHRGTLTRFCVLANTDKKLIGYIENLIGPEFTYWQDKSKWNRRLCATVQIQHRDLIGVLLQAIIPYMVSKRAKAELVLEFIKNRNLTGYHNLTEEQLGIVDSFRKLNGGNGKKDIYVY